MEERATVVMNAMTSTNARKTPDEFRKLVTFAFTPSISVLSSSNCDFTPEIST